jgi:hypothetical protein
MLAIRTDNMVTVFNLRRNGASGGMLLKVTRAIFSLLTAMDIRLQITHVPGVENILTDALSRMDVVGDYSLTQEMFRKATTDLSVTPTIDLFATTSNHKLQRFAALPGRNGEGVEVRDALSIPWTNEVPYLFPPVQLIPRVLQKLRMDAVKEAVLVFPLWPSQPWWSLLPDSVVKMVELGQSTAVLVRGPSLTVEHKLPPGAFAMAKLRFA